MFATLRHLVKVAIRLFALIIVCVVLFRTAREAIEFTVYHLWDGLWSRPIYTARIGLVWAVPWLGLAVLLWLFHDRIAKAVVPRMERTCGECGYSLRGLKTDRCPECGTEIPQKSKAT